MKTTEEIAILRSAGAMARISRSFLLLTGTAFCLVALAADIPRLKPGLWEMHVQSSSGGVNSAVPSTVCVGAMPDSQRQLEEANIKSRCSKYESREAGGKCVVDAVCTARGKTVTKHTVTGLGGDSFHEENTAPQGNMTSDGKWLGPCKPGQVPDTFK
jgi:hypothetical protein